MVYKKIYEGTPFCEKEILRYAGCKATDCETEKLMKMCIDEVKDKLKYQVCYCEMPVKAEGICCDFEAFSLRSKNLVQNLQNCKRVIIFAATVGVEIDRLIAKYGHISPANALMFQAIGAERIEALCDMFCHEIAKEKGMGLKPRFSPGYGDLPLSAQKDIFSILMPERQIGLTLTDSLLMSPSKSVTAIAGLSEQVEIERNNKCSICEKIDCIYRGVS